MQADLTGLYFAELYSRSVMLLLWELHESQKKSRVLGQRVDQPGQRVATLEGQKQTLKDALAEQKDLPKRPNVGPSELEGAHSGNEKERKNKGKGKKGGRKGRQKRKHRKETVVHNTVCLKVEDVPEGSRFLGYRDFLICDILIQPQNTLYRRACWRTTDGKLILAEKPEWVRGEFCPKLRAYYLVAVLLLPRAPSAPSASVA